MCCVKTNDVKRSTRSLNSHYGSEQIEARKKMLVSRDTGRRLKVSRINDL